MEVRELRAKREELERSLHKFITDALLDFENETGFCPSYISINLIDIAFTGNLQGKRIVESVKVGIEL